MNRESPNPPGKPVLDQATFQQLLAAAYTLQQQTIHLRVGKAADAPPALSAGAATQKIQQVPLVSLAPRSCAETKLPVKPGIALAQTDPEPLASRYDSALQPETDTRPSRRRGEVLYRARLKPRYAKSTELILPVKHPVPRGICGSRRRKTPPRISPGHE